MAIFVYNREKEMFDGENNYRIYRPYLLGNPYTHIRNRETKAMYIVGSREEAVQKYSHYFDVMYQTNLDFRDVVDEMYEKYNALPPEKEGIATAKGIMERIEKQ